ncbi:MAG: phosphatase PAP2 family protein [Armatimonadia bacterium]
MDALGKWQRVSFSAFVGSLLVICSLLVAAWVGTVSSADQDPVLKPDSYLWLAGHLGFVYVCFFYTFYSTRTPRENTKAERLQPLKAGKRRGSIYLDIFGSPFVLAGVALALVVICEALWLKPAVALARPGHADIDPSSLVNTFRGLLHLPAVFDSAPSGFTMRLTVALLLVLCAGRGHDETSAGRSVLVYSCFVAAAAAMLVFSAYQRVQAREHFVDDVALGVAAGTALTSMGAWAAIALNILRTRSPLSHLARVNLGVTAACLGFIALYARFPMMVLAPWFAMGMMQRFVAAFERKDLQSVWVDDDDEEQVR